MFFISPIKAIYNIKFYLQTLKEPLWKAFLFIIYLFVLGSIFLTLYMPINMKPEINNIITQVVEVIPEIKINKGTITVNDNQRLELAPQALEGYKVVFDTGSAEPGYPTQMEKENIIIYVNKNTVFTSYNGQFQKHEAPKDTEFTISKNMIQQDQQKIVDFIAYFIVVVFLIAFFLRLLLLTVIALIIVFIISASSRKNISFSQKLILALYMQAPIVILDLILLILPTHILGMSALLSLVIYVIYANLIFANIDKPLTVKEISQEEEAK